MPDSGALGNGSDACPPQLVHSGQWNMLVIQDLFEHFHI